MGKIPQPLITNTQNARNRMENPQSDKDNLLKIYN